MRHIEALWQLAASELPVVPLALEARKRVVRDPRPFEEYLYARWQTHVRAATAAPDDAAKLKLLERAAEVQIIMRELLDESLQPPNNGTANDG